MNRDTLRIDTGGATLDQVAAVARGMGAVLDAEARGAVRQARLRTEDAARSSRPVYGVNTGFGRLAGTVVDREDLSRLQRNLLLSHACGTGPLFEEPVTRVMMFLRAASLARGRSGIREETLDLLLAILNSDAFPAVPSKGSLGASGDLAPLAHLCLPLIGEGSCILNGEKLPSGTVLRLIGLAPVVLGAKEGLALINGTQAMTAVAALALLEACELADAADTSAAMSLEVLLGTTAPFQDELIRLRPHPGALETARNLRTLLEGSEILLSHGTCGRVQDAYSLRCVPQVHGASRDAMDYVRRVIEVELRSVTDNPLLMEDGSFVSGGNFHGQPMALAADHLAIASAELADISERRLERLLNPDLSGLPAFLAPDPGLNSGFMIAQYTAASLVSENKILAHPASVDSIPVSGSQEDHVSMGTIAARKALEVVRNSRHVIATELVCAAQASEFLHRGRRGHGTAAAYNIIREVVKSMDSDRQFVDDIDRVSELVAAGAFRPSVLLSSNS
jgi:histidine ammonia-lyase